MAMFSEGQLAKFNQKRISQETFDEAVQSNIADFDMEPEEALQSAIEEFQAQGVDLSNIIKTAAGGDLSAHPAAAAVAALRAAAAAGDGAGTAAAARDVAAAAASTESGDQLAVLQQAGAGAALAEGLRAAADASDDPGSLLAVLRAVAGVLGTAHRELQAAFLAADGAAALQQVLADDLHGGDVAAAALAAAAAVGLRSEAGKAALMAAGAGGAAIAALGRWGEEAEAVAAACAVLCALTNPDDDSQPASRAFPNARALAADGAAAALVAALRRHEAQPPAATAAAAAALRSVAANDEICQEVAAAGGVALALHILKGNLDDARLARLLCALLRQLASSDGAKAALVEGGGLALLPALLGDQGARGVQEAALGLLTNVTLRNPEAAAEALGCGCADALLELMRRGLASPAAGKENRAAAAVQRQACMALRNMAVRNAEVRAALLERGAEGLVRGVKAAFPSACGEAGAAALRDLGLDDYHA